MKKIILSIMILIFLTGCGIFDIDDWVVPDDAEFLALIQELDTPKKIGQYMKNNFTYNVHLFSTSNPYTLWKTKKGDCNDFATFGVFVAHYHGYGTYQIEIFYNGTISKHWIAIYVEEDKMSFTSNQYFSFRRFNTFKEIVEYDNEYGPNKWRKYIIYNYENNIVETGYNN